MKHRYILLIVSLIICLFLSTIVVAQEEEELVDPDIPDSWYEAPKTASEMNIEDFQQSPMLDEIVSEGELPPVKERLPEDPIVQEPYNKIGEYGGTVVAWDTSIDNYELNYWNNMNQGTGSLKTPDGSETIPFYLKKWEFSNNYKKITLYLREGMKWSDGEELTADDYIYWWEHYANNEALTPVPPEKWSPPLLDVTKEDKYSITFHYDKSVPTRFMIVSGMITGGDLAPAHFMKQIHPEFVGKEKVEEMSKDKGLERWEEYYLRIHEDSPTHPEYDHQRPVLTPYIALERTETELILERNPYFPVIDPKGNQLPYIDKISVNVANDAEMASTKAATGEATFAGRNLNTSDIPLYKRNEEKENYTTLLYTRPYGSEVNVKPVYTTEDEKLREIFWDERYRKALSLSIDRENINEKIYYGHAVPRQMTIIPTHELFEESFAEAYAEYDPEKAKEFLDDMGMVDVDDDGYRETPNGEKFTPELLYCKMGPVDPTNVLELLKSNWEDIGLNIQLKNVSRELWDQRRQGNKLEMTVWTGEALTVQNILNWLAPGTHSAHQAFIGWDTWFKNPEAEEAMEPPAIMKELNELAQTAMYSTDEEERYQATKEILEIQAEKLWHIGTVGMGPQPLIASNNLKNIPQKGYWISHGMQYLLSYRPWQMYLEE